MEETKRVMILGCNNAILCYNAEDKIGEIFEVSHESEVAVWVIDPTQPNDKNLWVYHKDCIPVVGYSNERH